MLQINIEDFSEFEDYDDDNFEDEDEPPRKVAVMSKGVRKSPQTNTSSQDSQGSSDSSSSDIKKPTKKQKASHKVPKEDPEIISRLNEMNNALMQSNKAKAASTVPTILNTALDQQKNTSIVSNGSTSLSIQRASLVTPAKPSYIAAKLPETVRSVPTLLVKTNNGIAFSSIPKGMIVRVIQGAQSNLVSLPINSVLANGVAIIKTPEGR